MARVGIIADTHLPFSHPMYLKFVQDTFKEYKCDTFVHIGDFADQHAVAPNYDPDPAGMSSGQEGDAVRVAAKAWYKAFPKLKVCIGNHDERHFRSARLMGVADSFLKGYKELWQTPNGWDWDFKFKIDGVLYEHGTGTSGKNAALMRAIDRRQSTVIGHTHTFAGISFHANDESRIFGMNVGCGIDLRAYAFNYGRDQVVRPVLGCGVIINGTDPFFIPMPCGPGEKYCRIKN